MAAATSHTGEPGESQRARIMRSNANVIWSTHRDIKLAEARPRQHQQVSGGCGIMLIRTTPPVMERFADSGV